MALIPGPPARSLPQLGAFGLRRPHELATDLHRRYGNVVRLGIGPAAYVYVFGEAANRLVLVDHPDSFTWREALRSLEPLTGSAALVLSDGQEHRRRRQLVQPAFASRRIDAAVSVLTNEMDRLIDALPLGIPVDLHAHYRSAARRIVVRVLFGEAPDGLADKVGAVLEPAMRFVDRAPNFQVAGSLGWWRARRARRRADSLVAGSAHRPYRLAIWLSVGEPIRPKAAAWVPAQTPGGIPVRS